MQKNDKTSKNKKKKMIDSLSFGLCQEKYCVIQSKKRKHMC